MNAIDALAGLAQAIDDWQVSGLSFRLDDLTRGLNEAAEAADRTAACVERVGAACRRWRAMQNEPLRQQAVSWLLLEVAR